MNVTYLAQANWDRLGGTLVDAIKDTLIMVATTLVVAGIIGLVLGILLYTTRPGGILQNKPIHFVINILVNFIRPIPFIILLAFVQPLTVAVLGSSIGREPGHVRHGYRGYLRGGAHRRAEPRGAGSGRD